MLLLGVGDGGEGVGEQLEHVGEGNEKQAKFLGFLQEHKSEWPFEPRKLTDKIRRETIYTITSLLSSFLLCCIFHGLVEKPQRLCSCGIRQATGAEPCSSYCALGVTWQDQCFCGRIQRAQIDARVLERRSFELASGSLIPTSGARGPHAELRVWLLLRAGTSQSFEMPQM